jgi:hypothetical protein
MLERNIMCGMQACVLSFFFSFLSFLWVYTMVRSSQIGCEHTSVVGQDASYLFMYCSWQPSASQISTQVHVTQVANLALSLQI